MLKKQWMVDRYISKKGCNINIFGMVIDNMAIKQQIKTFLNLLAININDVRLYINHVRKKDEICNIYKTNFQRNALIKYIVHPFFSQHKYEKHQNEWQVKEIARLIAKQGYNVDVVSFDSKYIKYKKKYDLLLDISPGMNDVPDKYFNDRCIKIAYMTGMDPSVAKKNEEKRLLDVRNRRGFILPRDV